MREQKAQHAGDGDGLVGEPAAGRCDYDACLDTPVTILLSELAVAGAAGPTDLPRAAGRRLAARIAELQSIITAREHRSGHDIVVIFDGSWKRSFLAGGARGHPRHPAAIALHLGDGNLITVTVREGRSIRGRTTMRGFLLLTAGR